MTEKTPEIEQWEGAIGPQSEDDPVFYELTISGETVRLVGPAPGYLYEFNREEFETLVQEGDWTLAEDDPEEELYRTPEGEQPY